MKPGVFAFGTTIRVWFAMLGPAGRTTLTYSSLKRFCAVQDDVIRGHLQTVGFLPRRWGDPLRAVPDVVPQRFVVGGAAAEALLLGRGAGGGTGPRGRRGAGARVGAGVAGAVAAPERATK